MIPFLKRFKEVVSHFPDRAAVVDLEDMMGQERISYVVEDSDARLTLLSARAVRIMALAAVPMSLTYLLTSYY